MSCLEQNGVPLSGHGDLRDVIRGIEPKMQRISRHRNDEVRSILAGVSRHLVAAAQGVALSRADRRARPLRVIGTQSAASSTVDDSSDEAPSDHEDVMHDDRGGGFGGDAPRSPADPVLPVAKRAKPADDEARPSARAARTSEVAAPSSTVEGTHADVPAEVEMDPPVRRTTRSSAHQSRAPAPAPATEPVPRSEVSSERPRTRSSIVETGSVKVSSTSASERGPTIATAAVASASASTSSQTPTTSGSETAPKSIDALPRSQSPRASQSVDEMPPRDRHAPVKRPRDESSTDDTTSKSASAGAQPAVVASLESWVRPLSELATTQQKVIAKFRTRAPSAMVSAFPDIVLNARGTLNFDHMVRC